MSRKNNTKRMCRVEFRVSMDIDLNQYTLTDGEQIEWAKSCIKEEVTNIVNRDEIEKHILLKGPKHE